MYVSLNVYLLYVCNFFFLSFLFIYLFIYFPSFHVMVFIIECYPQDRGRGKGY